MDWKEQADQFFVDDGSLFLRTKKTDLKNGIEVGNGKTVLFRAFTIPDKGFSELNELTFRRGRDLFANFQKEHVSAECYWRLPATPLSDFPKFQLESIVSLRSSKLTTERIQFCLSIDFLVENIFPLPEIENGFGLPDQDISGCILIHPDDQDEVQIIHSGQEARIDIDVPWLERGVIRRVRFLMAVWKGSIDEQKLKSIADEFENSEIPLTT